MASKVCLSNVQYNNVVMLIINVRGNVFHSQIVTTAALPIPQSSLNYITVNWFARCLTIPLFTIYMNMLYLFVFLLQKIFCLNCTVAVAIVT